MTKVTKEFDWDAKMKRIEEIVKTLEAGGAGLDESIKLFEEGTKLVQESRKELDRAELRVTKLIEENGSFKETLFEEGSDDS